MRTIDCQSEAEWLAERQKGIGGSDAAAAVGLSPWKTPLELYLEKTGQLAVEANEDMRRGTLMEPVVRQLYCDATGRTVVKPAGILRNPRYPWALANLDGIASNSIIFEGKTSRSRVGWGDPGTPEVPMVYLLQCVHYFAVTELPFCDVAVMFGDFDIGIYSLERDEELIAMLMEGEKRFCDAVESRTPPDPVSSSDIIRRWPRSKPIAVSAEPHHVQAALILAAVKQQIKELEEIEAQASDLLKRQIADAEALEYEGSVLATWKSCKTNPRFDAARFRAENPQLYEQYLVDAPPQRRFLLKDQALCQLTNATTELPALLSEAVPTLPD